MSLKCGGIGLNLTRGNHVISLDLGWSNAVDQQAFDRVYRLGQTKGVFINRLMIKDTVEARVRAIQQRKQSLSDGALGEGSGQRIRLSVGELAHCECFPLLGILQLIRLQCLVLVLLPMSKDTE